MEFRDFYSEQGEEYISKNYRALIDRCNAYMRKHPQSQFWIRDTDHMFSSIRLECSNVPEEDYKDVVSICAKCGSNTHLNWEDEDFGGILICDYCHAKKEEKGWEKVKILLRCIGHAALQSKQESVSPPKHFSLFSFFRKKKKHIDSPLISNTQSIHNIEKAKNTRVRVLTSLNTLLYLTLDKLGLDENEDLYILHDDDKTDIVKFAGIYLNGRDKQEERLFQGDIVKFDCENVFGRIVCGEGVLLGKEYSHNTHRYHYIILDNRSNNMPPNPDLIDKKSIEVIGNIYENPEYKIGGCEAKYYVYDIK